MIDELKSKLQELESMRNALKPKIDEMNSKRDEEIQGINEQYDAMIAEVNSDVEAFETQVKADFIQSFLDAVMKEFDAKRSMSEYSVTNEIKEYKEYIATIEFFPTELVERLEKITSGSDPIENLAYEIDNIKEKYS